MKRPERLWEQYYGKANAEAARGIGVWPLQASPCALEPPFDPYDRKTLTPWDCAINDWEGPWEGNWYRRHFALRPVHPLGEPIELPSTGDPSKDDLVPIVIEQFPEDDSTIPKADQLLRSLPDLARPVSFELLGLGPQSTYDEAEAKRVLENRRQGGKRSLAEAICGWKDPYTVCQFVAEKSDARRLARQLLAHYPNSAVVLGDRLPVNDLPGTAELQMNEAFGATLALHHFYCTPLRVFGRLDPDPLGVAISAMDDLDKEDWAILQILFQPVLYNWPENLREAICDPYKDEIMLPEVTEKTLREKFGTPLFAVSVRIAASRQDVFRQLQGWTEQFANPPQGFWPNDVLWENGKLSDDEAWTLGLSIENRCTYRPGVLLNIEELASLVHLPSSAVVSERLRQVKTRTRPAVETNGEAGSVLIGNNVHRGKTTEARIDTKLRARHCYLAGASGTGKSTLLMNMIVQDIEAGEGVGLLDPHGDLVRAVLRRIPEERIDDVILFDPTDEKYPFALNILDAKDHKERERIVAETLMALMRYFPGSWGPRLERILTFTLYTVLEAVPGATLADVERMLIDEEFRAQVLLRTRTPRYVDFWNREFAFLPKNACDPVLNKLSVFLINPTVRNVICQRRSAIDFDALLNERKILLANLSTGLLSERIAGTLGSFLVTKIVSAAFRRAAINEQHRIPWYLYVGEFQSFMNLSVGFDTILAEARKYKLVLAGLANQYVGQLSPEVRQAIFGNVGTMICFRLGVDDANLAAKEMGIFTADEILNLEVGQAIVRAGGSATAFNVQTYREPDVKDANRWKEILRHCRQRYARPRADVESELDAPASPTERSALPPKQRDRKKGGSSRKTERPQSPPTDASEDDLVS